jgi:CheY-like chemotaxis protein
MAGRVARAVGSEQSPEQILESASLVAELTREFEASQSGTAAAVAREAPRTVLLVAPGAAERHIIRSVLDRLDCAVLEVRTGAEAVAICATDSGPIDLVVTTASLPDMRGADLAARLAVLRPTAVVLSASGDADEDLARRLAVALGIECAG